MLPSDSDLEYPEVEKKEGTSDDITVVGQINLGELTSGEAQKVVKRQVNAREKRSKLPPPTTVEGSSNYEEFTSRTDPDIGHVSAEDMVEQTKITPLQALKDKSLPELDLKDGSKGLIKRNIENVNSQMSSKPKKKRDDRLMGFFLLSLLLIILILLVLQKFNIIDKIIPPAKSAIAQENIVDMKKKSLSALKISKLRLEK